MADQGLKYRLNNGSCKPGSWKQLAPYPVDKFNDSTGCGDWCSAGILHKIGGQGRAGFLSHDETKIIKALNFGQALGAVNGQYEGARGPMYQLKRADLMKGAQKLEAGKKSAARASSL